MTESYQPPEPISFVTVVNDFDELGYNLMASAVAGSKSHEWIVIDNTGNRLSGDLSKLYLDGLNRASHDLVFFFHQDVYIPDGWERQVFAALAELEALDPAWGVLGAVGVLPATAPPPKHRGHWADPHGSGFQYFGPLPAEVLSLDELWLGLRKSRGVSFDPALPGLHCYGTDLCLTASSLGLRSYAINAPVWHKYKDPTGKRVLSKLDSEKIMKRNTPEFLAALRLSKDYVGRKWRSRLPFRSTSMRWEVGEY